MTCQVLRLHTMTAALAEQLGDDDPDAIIGATVRALVSANRADTGALARALGISRNSYYNRINGEKAWHARDVYRAAAFFGCSIQDIYDGNVRVGRHAGAPVTDTYTPRYRGPSSPRRPLLTLVSGHTVSNPGVAHRYGSSPPDTEHASAPTITRSAGTVNDAYAA